MQEFNETLARSDARAQLAGELRIQAAEMEAGMAGLERLRAAAAADAQANLLYSQVRNFIDKRLVDLSSARETLLSNADFYEVSAQTLLDEGGQN